VSSVWLQFFCGFSFISIENKNNKAWFFTSKNFSSICVCTIRHECGIFLLANYIILGIPFILASRHQFSACCVKQKNINPVLVPFWTFLMKSWDKDLSYLNVHFSHIHNRSWLIWPTLLCYYHPLELLTRSIQSKTLWYFDLEEKWETVISLSNGVSYPCN